MGTGRRNLVKHYENLERRVSGCVQQQPEYAPLVVPNGNDHAPVHRWFHFKEGFSNVLLPKILEDFGYPKDRKLSFFDPFAGVGTSVTSCYEARKLGWDITGWGTEINPLLQFIASTKAHAPKYDADQVEEWGERILSELPEDGVRIPELSSLRNPEVISRDTVLFLLACRHALSHRLPKVPAVRPLLVGLASIVEDLSNVRKDGRALRLVEKGARPQRKRALKTAWTSIASDLREIPNRKAAGHVELGDGRLPIARETCSQDFALYSPPYPNNIDYTEVYKLELWILGFISSREEFRAQRLKTLRSHPSITFPDHAFAKKLGFKDRFDRIVQPILDHVPDDHYARGRRMVIEGYFDDLLMSLYRQYSLLKRGGRIFCVIGNSIHGKKSTIVIAADLVASCIAELVGFDVERIAVARQLTRRETSLLMKPYVRESVVVLRKP